MTKQEEFAAKLERVRHFAKHNNLDGVVLSRADNFAWLGCGANSLVNNASETGVATFVVGEDTVTLLANNIEIERIPAEELHELEAFSTQSFPWHDPTARTGIIQRLTAGGRFAADDASVGLPDLPAAFNRLRFALTEAEIERYARLGRDASAAMEDAARALAPGMGERDGAALVQMECQRRGIMPVVLLVAADERIRKWRHPIVKDARINRQVMLVICGRRQGLIAVLTRIVHFGEPSEDLKRRHEAVCEVDAAMMAATKPGVRAADVLAVARRAYAENGFADEWQFHHQGGAVGYRPREYIANPLCEEVVQDRQAFAWNPSICGTKSEDTMLATAAGPKLITEPSPGWPALAVERDGLTLRRAQMLVQ
jgi:antitoxin VapB